jgi:hypothetical protein
MEAVSRGTKHGRKKECSKTLGYEKAKHGRLSQETIPARTSSAERMGPTI